MPDLCAKRGAARIPVPFTITKRTYDFSPALARRTPTL